MTADNILKYPESCIVGKTITQETFCKFLSVNTDMQRNFQDDVSSITWLYKISPHTLSFKATKDICEVEFFLAELKKRDCGESLFSFIDMNVPQYIVFILRCEGQIKLLINYKEWKSDNTPFTILQSFETGWLAPEQCSLPIQGRDLSAIYEGFVRYIAGNQLQNTKSSLKEDVQLFQKQKEITSRIATLQRNLNKEKQPRRKLELHQQIIQLRQQLND